MDQPGGPSNQRLTSSGLVRASKTRSRVAANARVIIISQSPEEAILSVAVLFMFFSFSWVRFLPIQVFAWISFLRGERRDAESLPPTRGDSPRPNRPLRGWCRA